MRRFAFILILLSSVAFAVAEEADYFCVVCGKGPLTGQIWISKWGAVCDACYKLENHCSLCYLPVREGGGTIKTGDGRFICKFDKKNAVLDADTAKDIYSESQRDLVSIFGPGFALQYPDVSVNLFDVDYWSEKGRGDGLHKFGFSSTRKTPSGKCTHQVVMLSGQLRDDIAATAAHEYTHLWINENRPATRSIDGDTVEAICELAAYELMDSRGRREQQKKILGNPYTHGAIAKLVEVDRERGFRYVLNWVKEGAAANFETTAAAVVAPVKIPAMTSTNVPVALPVSLKLGGLLVDGKMKHAVISGVSFAAGETKSVKLREREVRITCREIQRDAVVFLVAGEAALVTLKIGEEKFLP
jgi:hypothetical protein